MISNVPKPSMGLLNLHTGEKKFRLSRYTPSEDIGFFVRHFWIVSWDLTGQEPYLQHVVPNPCVNMVIERDRTAIYGAAKHTYSQLIQDKGCVFGVKFKPGGFYPFIKQPIVGLMNNPMGAQSIFGMDARTIESIVLSQDDESTMVELAESMFRPKLPEQDEQIPFINQIIDSIVAEREITKVDHICERFNINIRKLQRMFGQYVGISPKWVIKLYRLQNTAETVEKGGQLDWLKLSMELGYHDQSHFIKDFKAAVGKTPDEYARLK